jgi:hypothetical protein
MATAEAGTESHRDIGLPLVSITQLEPSQPIRPPASLR